MANDNMFIVEVVDYEKEKGRITMSKVRTNSTWISYSGRKEIVLFN